MAKNEKNLENKVVETTPSTKASKTKMWLFGVLSFVIPPVGYVLYLVWKKSNHSVSTFCGWGSLTGSIFDIILAIILILVL